MRLAGWIAESVKAHCATITGRAATGKGIVLAYCPPSRFGQRGEVWLSATASTSLALEWPRKIRANKDSFYNPRQIDVRKSHYSKDIDPNWGKGAMELVEITLARPRHSLDNPPVADCRASGERACR